MCRAGARHCRTRPGLGHIVPPAQVYIARGRGHARTSMTMYTRYVRTHPYNSTNQQSRTCTRRELSARVHPYPTSLFRPRIHAARVVPTALLFSTGIRCGGARLTAARHGTSLVARRLTHTRSHVTQALGRPRGFRELRAERWSERERLRDRPLCCYHDVQR